LFSEPRADAPAELTVIFSHHQVYIKKKKGGHFLGGSGIEYDKKLSKPLGI
jgi:hypothetical protein